MKWSTLLLVFLVGLGVTMAHWPERQERTPPARCFPPNPCFPSRQTIADFAANISGTVYQPSDAEYPNLVTSANQRLTRHPALVVLVASESDVQKAVLFARKFHLMLTVAGENGDFTRGSYEDAAMQINLSQLKSVNTVVDLQATTTDPGIVTAQAGVTWPELSAAAASVNRVVVTDGVGPHPIGDATQAGGAGPISRSLGLIADNLLSARLVTMGGSVVDVSDAGATINTADGVSRFTTVDPGIWRALRGGGSGSFGIVVSYTFQMHVPTAYVTQLSASYVLYENNQFVGREPLRYLLPRIYALPDQWGGYVFLSGRTSATTVGQKGQLYVDLVHYGNYNSASYNAIADILNYDGNGARLSVSVVNRTNVDSYVSNVVSDNQAISRGYAFNTLLPASALQDADTLDSLVDTFLLLLNDPAVDAHYGCSLEPLGGAIGTMNSTGFVKGSLRQAAMSLLCGLGWNDADGIRDDKFVAYAMEYAKKIKSFGIGTDLSVGAFEDEDNWKHTLYGDYYNDLLKVKLKYDVDNYLWCHNCVGSDFTLRCPNGCDRSTQHMRAKLDGMRRRHRDSVEEFDEEDDD